MGQFKGRGKDVLAMAGALAWPASMGYQAARADDEADDDGFDSSTVPGGSEAAWRQWLAAHCDDPDDPEEETEDDYLDLVWGTLETITRMVQQGQRVGPPQRWYEHADRECDEEEAEAEAQLRRDFPGLL
jgi:hypothetical protein